jgi:hypothetical protein
VTEDEIAALLSHIDALARERDAAVLAEREACAALAFSELEELYECAPPDRETTPSTPAPVQP